MRRVLLAALASVALFSQAQAGDRWSGFYLGGHAGYGWGDSTTSSANSVFSFGSGSISSSPDGAFAGGQFGFNAQNGPVVLGIEVDFAWAGIDGRGTLGANNIVDAEYKSLAAVSGRLGYAFDRALLYAKGGVGFADLRNFATDTLDPLDTTVADKVAFGYTIGGGLEYALDRAWSIKAEYQYFNFNDDRRSTNFDGDIYVHKNDLQTVKLGINYRFGAK